MTWIADNIGSVIVAAVLVLIVTRIVISLRRNRKRGKGCSCGGSCAECGGCCHCPPTAADSSLT